MESHRVGSVVIYAFKDINLAGKVSTEGNIKALGYLPLHRLAKWLHQFPTGQARLHILGACGGHRRPTHGLCKQHYS